MKMLFASHPTLTLTFTILLRADVVLGGNCINPSKIALSEADPDGILRQNPHIYRSTSTPVNVNHRRTPSRHLTPYRHYTPPFSGILPAASYFRMFRSRSAPPSRPHNGKTATSTQRPHVQSVSMPEQNLLGSTSTSHSSGVSRLANPRRVSVAERRHSGPTQTVSGSSQIIHSAPKPRRLNLSTDGNRLHSTGRARNARPMVSPELTPRLPIIRESVNELDQP